MFTRFKADSVVVIELELYVLQTLSAGFAIDDNLSCSFVVGQPAGEFHILFALKFETNLIHFVYVQCRTSLICP